MKCNNCGNEFEGNCCDKCGDSKDYEFQEKLQPKEVYAKNPAESEGLSGSNTDTHFLFSFIRPVDPSGLPFDEIHVSIDIATGRPFQQSFFCTSPSFPPAPIASAPVPISFDKLLELALCELEEYKAHIEKTENENRADQAEWYKKCVKKLERIVGTTESDWKTLLDL